jgi:hypothetical protein
MSERQNSAPFEAVGRNLFFKNFDKGSAMTQADLNELVKAVQLRATVTVIGDFTAGTSESVNMVIEGFPVDTIAGYTVATVSF